MAGKNHYRFAHAGIKVALGACFILASGVAPFAGALRAQTQNNAQNASSDAPSPQGQANSPMSPQCQAPAGDIAAPAPLPNLAAALSARREIRILAIGSSSTFGVGASSGWRNYPAQLTEILERNLNGAEIEIVNRGVSGEVAATTAERLKSEVAVEHPDLVLWQLGTNDALARVPPEEFERTVRSTVEWLKANKVDVVLVGLQYAPRFARDENYKAIRDVLLRIAASENVLYIRRYEAMQFLAKTRSAPALVSPDDLHLNDLGYRCMAEHIAQAVIANLFPKRIRPNLDAHEP